MSDWSFQSDHEVDPFHPSRVQSEEVYGELHPTAAIVNALKGRTVVEASCDGEGMDDVWLLLDDDTVVLIGTELDETQDGFDMAQVIGRSSPWPRLIVWTGPKSELWPRREEAQGDD